MVAPAMTIDELARMAGTTTRNVRALQTSCLLIKPEILGRRARYGEAHLARLSAVLRLQREGFSIASIRALLEAMSAGLSLADVLGEQHPGPEVGSDAPRSGPGPSPDPHGHLFFGASAHPAADMPEDPQEVLREDPGTPGPGRYLRLLSDIPTNVLDEAGLDRAGFNRAGLDHAG